MRNLYKFTKIYSGGEPDFEEGDVFKLTVPLEATEPEEPTAVVSERQMAILRLLQNDDTLGATEIAKQLSVSRRTISRDIQILKELGYLEYDKKTRKWNILN